MSESDEGVSDKFKRNSPDDMNPTEFGDKNIAGDREPNNLWLIGILSPVLFLLLKLLQYTVPQITLGSQSVRLLYFGTGFISIACVFADSRYTPNEYPGNRIHQVAIGIDVVALLAFVSVLLIPLLDWGDGGLGAIFVVVIILPILILVQLIPAGTAVWYVWMRHKLLRNSQPSEPK